MARDGSPGYEFRADAGVESFAGTTGDGRVTLDAAVDGTVDALEETMTAA